jgi:hypothetical protein
MIASHTHANFLTTSLLPQQIAPINDIQAKLTDNCLAGLSDSLMPYFFALREETDTLLALQFPYAAGKAYPYGRCEEITSDLYARLAQRIQFPSNSVEHALHNFVAHGGIIHTIWGILRDQYFQNAIQIGHLYIDVSNDTVFVTKLKIEILPIESCGLVAVKNLAHFRQTAESYWGGHIYANHLIPTLAPLLPMISYSPKRLQPSLQSACDYMIALACRDEFQEAEEWLREGPTPPSEIANIILATTPTDLTAWTTHGKTESISACQRARAAHCQVNDHWRNARVMDYLRLGTQKMQHY